MIIKYPKSKIEGVLGLSGVEEASAVRTLQREEKIQHLQSILDNHKVHTNLQSKCGACYEANKRLMALEIDRMRQEPF